MEHCLEIFRKKQKLTYAGLGRLLGTRGKTVERYCKRERSVPREPYLGRIRVLLGSDFRAEDFLGFIPPAGAPIGFESGPPVAAHPPDPPP